MQPTTDPPGSAHECSLQAAEFVVEAKRATAEGDLALAERLRDDAVRGSRKALDAEDPTRAMAAPMAHYTLGMVAWARNDFPSARNEFAEVVELRRSQGGALLAAALDDLAIVDYFTGAADSALLLRREALSIAETTTGIDGQLLRKIRRRYAQSLHKKGADQEAKRRLLQCRPDDGDPLDDHVGWLNAMALICEERDEVEEAANYYDDLIDVLSDGGFGESAAAALGNAVIFKLVAGNVRRAAGLLSRMRHLCSADRKLASTVALLDVRAAVLGRRGRAAAAATVAARAAQLFERTNPEATTLLNRYAALAQGLRAAGRISEARELLERCLPYQGETSEAATALLVELADLDYSEGNFERAGVLLTDALAAELGWERPEAKWRIFSLLGRIAEAEGRNGAAVFLGKLAVAQIRSTALSVATGDLAGWMNSRILDYDRVLGRLALAGRLPEAHSIQLRRWQDIARELGSRGEHFVAAPADIPFRPAETSLLRVLESVEAMHRPALDGSRPPNGSARTSANAWLAAVRSADLGQLPPLAVAVQSSIPVLSFVPAGGRLRGVLQTASATTEFDVPLDNASLARATLELRTALQERSPNWQAPAVELYRALLAPIEWHLQDVLRLDILLSGLLSFVPFPALWTGKDFLGQRHAIAVRTGQPYRPSPGLAANWRGAAFATSGSVLAPLSGAPREAAALINSLGGALYLDSQFTSHALSEALRAGASVVHLASHFHYRPAHPLGSALLMGNGEELTLTALASAEFDFSQVELLVLSACDTAITDASDIGLEGLAGLAQSKGAGIVVGTLWRVGDDSTQYLMRSFYAHLVADPDRNPVEALARAQRSMIVGINDVVSPSVRRSGGLSNSTVQGAAWHPGDWAGFAIYVREPAGERQDPSISIVS